MRLVLVRHGQSEWNARRVLQGQADPALSALGRNQARALRPTIEALTPDHVITSDLMRARQTAELIGCDAVPDPGLREIDVGSWTSVPISELQARPGLQYQAWREGRFTPEGGESWADFRTRVVAAVSQAMGDGHRTLLVVCHGGVIRALLDAFLALQPAQIIPVGPASLCSLSLSPNTGNRLELFNWSPGPPDLAAPD